MNKFSTFYCAINITGYRNNDDMTLYMTLKFSRAENATAVNGSYFGGDDLSMIITDVGCSGNEANLTSCSFSLPDQHCDKTRQAGVKCLGKTKLLGKATIFHTTVCRVLYLLTYLFNVLFHLSSAEYFYKLCF